MGIIETEERLQPVSELHFDYRGFCDKNGMEGATDVLGRAAKSKPH